ncbi:HDOD domain-containing protein [Aquabacterium sp. A7-Y]|uniref:HDOD domain-containing protein n=1 Tax=Aquabacterium sp. A7-Y TaxID=1349605 RepID=UPI00223D837E|nr:HDOD domain-containing protein [Aquabacterium sp. A7-Y]MCW7542070.1 HDOD domain-containing protein [Aquabacterium sp. A7-Y]
MGPRRLPLLQSPLPDLAAWTACFRDAEIPVLPGTVQAVEALRAVEDQIDAHGIAEWVGHDPLMALKLLVHVARVRPRHFQGSTETVTAALVFLGISPFFRAFETLVSTDDLLGQDPAAHAGLEAVLHRASRAATFSLAFAVHRMDADAAVLHEAAMMHAFAELLLWCHAPALAQRITQRLQEEPGLRSAAAQREVLNITLAELEQALMRSWRLPEILIRVTDERHAEDPQVRNVALAVRLARHSAQGWDNPAIPDDIADIARLLNLSEAATYTKLTELEA